MHGPTITIEHLTKSFGEVLAVSDLSFTVEPGRVTGFLGPNGAGKTTTLRTLLGLVAPSAGSALIDGRRYRELERPLAMVGASLEPTVFHPGRSGRDHLLVQAIAGGIARDRVDAVLERVGLADAARRRVGGYSLGMRQRLGLASALLGDPGALVLDEPVNGLDPEGIRWIRGLLGELAAEGRTVLVSSHLLSEVQQTVTDVVVIAHGRLVHQGPLESLGGGAQVLVDSPDRERLRAALDGRASVHADARGLLVTGVTAAELGHLAFSQGIELSQLATVNEGLETVFLGLVGDDTAAVAS
ncbi:ATP-binding cassette domain-containing protein [Leifsonia sp. H3M29-4]|uniref:ATP-binding cassette domain-containing protein n=1 Tax=Salinibacterium metalliresistens TaxID=3031321 RepID=UPI0023DAD6D0|nr:ATP-binding cassette domain-containing protein [Salinibacterium metalliresistens]MDF1479476.1 ATP-binding cassette domain-containing protein [Salinibacterium metalliresistens]